MKFHRLEARSFEGVLRGQRFAECLNMTGADERRGKVSQRRKIAGGADRALARDNRQNTFVEHLDQEVHQRRPDPRVPLGQRGDFHSHHQAGFRRRQGLPGADRMGQHHVRLQGRKLIRRDRRTGQLTEARIYAVDRIAGREHIGHCAVGPCNGVLCSVGQRELDGCLVDPDPSSQPIHAAIYFKCFHCRGLHTVVTCVGLGMRLAGIVRHFRRSA